MKRALCDWLRALVLSPLGLRAIGLRDGDVLIVNARLVNMDDIVLPYRPEDWERVSEREFRYIGPEIPGPDVQVLPVWPRRGESLKDAALRMG